MCSTSPAGKEQMHPGHLNYVLEKSSVKVHTNQRAKSLEVRINYKVLFIFF